ncbi:MAG TPA: GGDEF domain-containing protein, partial [Candidatus Pelethenecus sp.]|nr:GGDEF domain-containing protein [Candidatus Pelethenecus sp.]
LSSVNNIQPKYSTSYRFNIGMRYAYIKESGTRITNGKTVELCGIIRTLDDYNYEKTQTELDVIKGEAEMLATMNQLYKQNRQFQAVLIRLDSIAKINEEYGRAFGNMALSQYIKLIHKNFVDEQMIFRLSGLEFMAIVQDYPKMEKLKNGIVHGEKLLHVDATFGTKKVKIDALMGICDSFDAKDAKDIYSKTKEALRFCSKPQFNASYAYYKDIR